LNEQVFTYAAPGLKFGRGASAEIGWDLANLGAKRVLVVTDPGVAAAGHVDRVASAITSTGIEAVVFDRTRVEPTDVSLAEAVAFGRTEGPFDAIVAVGGGSARSTPPRRSTCW
jgi:hydroxyacid-oxoacid transhydrogenase